MRKLIFILFALSASIANAAWDNGQAMKSGIIESIDVTGANNYAFRVVLEGAPAMCNGGDKWAFINESDSNYQVYVSVLLAAMAAGYKVTIYSNTVSGTPRCRIGYVKVQNK